MAATINTSSASNAVGTSASARPADGEGIDKEKPTLLCRIEGLGLAGRVNGAIILSRDEGLITVCDDRSVRVWLKRDSGQFWPSVCEFMPAAATAIDYNEQTDRLYVGLSNGMIHEFTVAKDLNSVREKRQLVAHTNSISRVAFSLGCEMVFSCGRDRFLVWHCSESGVRLGTYQCTAWCTALELDSATKYAFLGDFAGNIHVLHIVDAHAELISKLSAHTGSIRDLAWDHQRQLLFSGSADNLVIMWDIGGRRGQAYELTGHESKVCCLAYACGKKRLFSVDELGSLVCWDMDAHRLETPGWQQSDLCQQCDKPFFWNVSDMWKRKMVGLRQHHCRLCGRAVCANCCQNRSLYPPMGYQLPVRICDKCHEDMQADPERFDMRSLAVSTPLRQGMTCMCLDETKGQLLTVGFDRILMLWDVKHLVW